MRALTVASGVQAQEIDEGLLLSLELAANEKGLIIQEKEVEWGMTLNEFQASAARNIYRRDPGPTRLLWNFIGLVGEIGEIEGCLVEAPSLDKVDRGKILLEMGDTLWYLAAVADSIGSSLEEAAASSFVPEETMSVARRVSRAIPSFEEDIDSNVHPLMTQALGLGCGRRDLVDEIKKVVHQHKPVNRDRFNLLIAKVLERLSCLASSVNVSMSEVAEANEAKLLKRYPKGWSKEAEKVRFGSEG